MPCPSSVGTRTGSHARIFWRKHDAGNRNHLISWNWKKLVFVFCEKSVESTIFRDDQRFVVLFINHCTCFTIPWLMATWCMVCSCPVAQGDVRRRLNSNMTRAQILPFFFHCSQIIIRDVLRCLKWFRLNALVLWRGIPFPLGSSTLIEEPQHALLLQAYL